MEMVKHVLGLAAMVYVSLYVAKKIGVTTV